MKSKSTQNSLGFGTIARFGLIIIAATALALTAQAAQGKGNNGNPGILPPQAGAFGTTYAELQAEWWQWALGIPVAENPLLDATGENAALDQEGKVFFLAGSFGGVYERTCQVPAGKALFFPVVNNIWIGFPGDPPTPIEELRAIIAGWIDATEDVVSCEIDGEPIKNLGAYRTQSPVFDVEIPVDPDGWQAWGIPAGIDGPCVDDGIYLLLAPLSVGEHTIRFIVPDVMDVTYNLTVVPSKE
jgi:hypothetical protein